MPIDYERMKRVYPKQKAALTRAKKKGYDAVLAACRSAVEEWNEIGAWPDSWAIWDCALRDAALAERFVQRSELLITRLDQI